MSVNKKKQQTKIKQSELWNLDYTFYKWIVPRLIAFRDMPHRNGIPGNLKTMHEWNNILNTMIKGFELGIRENENGCLTPREKLKLDVAKVLFCNNLDWLWD